MIPSRLISITVVPRTSSGLLLAPRIGWCVRRNVLAVVLILLNIVYYSYCCDGLHQCTYFDVINVISYESGIFCLRTGYVLWLLWLQAWSDYRFRLQIVVWLHVFGVLWLQASYSCPVGVSRIVIFVTVASAVPLVMAHFSTVETFHVPPGSPWHSCSRCSFHQFFH